MPALALWLVLVGLSTRLLVSAWSRHVLTTEESPLLYHAATLGFNYFDFGFVRRGLGGSLLWLLGPNRLRSAAYFHVLSAAAVSAGACLLFARLQRPLLQRAVFAVLMAALMLRWAEDPARTDMLVAALIAAATIAMTAGRPVLAMAAVGVGLFVHENAFVFGVPLLAGLALDGGRWRAFDRRQVVGVAVVALVALGLYVLFERLPHADIATQVEGVRRHFPRHDYVDWAIYFAVSGGRGVATSLCQNANDPTYLLHVGGGLLVIALFHALLRAGGAPRWPVAVLVALPSFLFVSVVANDISRWAVLAAFNVWLLAAARAGGGATDAHTKARATSGTAADGRSGEAARGRAVEGAGHPIPSSRLDSPPTWIASNVSRRDAARLLIAVLMVPLIHPKTWPIEDPIFAPTPVLERLARRLGGPPTPRFVEVLQRCDPAWRSVLDAPAAPGVGAPPSVSR